MPASLTPQLIRLKLDITSRQSPADKIDKRPPSFWLSGDLRIELGLYKRSEVLDLTGLESITVAIKPQATGGGAPTPATVALMTETVAAVDFDDTLTEATWDDNSKAHVVVEFTANETNLDLAVNERALWFVCTGVTTDGKTITFGAGPIEAVEDGDNGEAEAGEPPVTLTYPTQTDARYFVRRSDITALTGGGPNALDGITTAGGATLAGTTLILTAGGVAVWQLIAGTNATDIDLGFVRPADYHATTNARVWERIPWAEDTMLVQVRQGTDAERLTLTLLVGELYWTTDTNKLWVGAAEETVGGVPAGGSAQFIADAGAGAGGAAPGEVDVSGGAGADAGALEGGAGGTLSAVGGAAVAGSDMFGGDAGTIRADGAGCEAGGGLIDVSAGLPASGLTSGAVMVYRAGGGGGALLAYGGAALVAAGTLGAVAGGNGGSLDLRGGAATMAGAARGGQWVSAGVGHLTGRGGDISMSGGTGGGRGGDIRLGSVGGSNGGDLSATTDGSAAAGSLSLTAAAGGAGGTWAANGASGQRGGNIAMSGGATARGGDITTANGGGDINTAGVGSIGMGVLATRTSLVGSASAARTVTLPNGTVTLAARQALGTSAATSGTVTLDFGAHEGGSTGLGSVLHKTLYLTSASTIAALTFSVTNGANCGSGSSIELLTRSEITAFTLAGSGQTFVGIVPATVPAGGVLMLRNVAANTWFVY